MKSLPDKRGYFGDWGGIFVPETLMAPLQELDRAYRRAQHDRAFEARLSELLDLYVGRPTPLYPARRLSARLGGAMVWLKREDLCHTGAHKINNALGQALLACEMDKRRVIAETGAGQHGVATATAAALLGLECRVYMGAEDMRRQALNVYRMQLMGAEVMSVAGGAQTLKDAINEALRDWVTNVRSTHYILGSVLGPHPYPMMVRDFQSVIGRETMAQFRRIVRGLPDLIIACVGGGSNAAGIFSAFVPHTRVKLVGVEAGGRGPGAGDHAARFAGGGAPGVLHGTRTQVIQDENGQIEPTHSVSAGLDYPAVGPEHANWRDTGRVTYTTVDDAEALAAFHLLAETEGIVPALESAHAIAQAAKVAPTMALDANIIVNLSGRGDKDLEEVARVEEGAVVSRIVEAFKTAKREGRAAFIPYVTCGDPSLEQSVAIAAALERAGADVLELGVPFSDPMADGPTNQRAAERALAKRTSLKQVLEVVREIRQRSQLAIVLFTYANPVVRFGIDRFAEHAAASGVDGVLFTDVPAEEMGGFRPALKAAHLDAIMLVTPTSTRARMKATAKFGGGFLYLVSRTGVTGAQKDLDHELATNVANARKASRLPVAVGFGISTPDQVAKVAAIADGVVVGSAIVNQIADEGDTEELASRVEAFAAPLAEACKRTP